MDTLRGKTMVVAGMLAAVLAVTVGLLFGGRTAPVQRDAPQREIAVAPSQPAGALPAPVMPSPARLSVSFATLRDPFQGGPYIKKTDPNQQKTRPFNEVTVYNLATAHMTDHRAKPPTHVTERARAAILARYSGWVYNSNGQAFALIEADGLARSLRVGDQLEGYTVTSIADDSLTLRAASGDTLTLPLHELGRGMAGDAYPGARMR
jgi:hypothetical protein